jgi:chromosomal replication initiator protein
MLSEIGFERSGIISGVARHYGVTVGEMRGRRRFRRVAEPRHVTAWLLRKHGMTIKDISEELSRDHSTIVYAVKRVEQLMREDGVFRARVMRLWRQLVAPIHLGEKSQECAADAEQYPGGKP